MSLKLNSNTHTTFRMLDSLASGANSTHVLNMPKLMSGINRRTFHNVDEQGNAQLYTLAISAQGIDAEGVVWSAPNTYYTRKAVKAWHRARVKMFKRAGISMKSLTPYARTLRPYLDVNHENGTTTELDTETSVSGGIVPSSVGEWNYSSAAVTVPAEEASQGDGVDVRVLDLVDTYRWTIMGDNVVEATDDSNSNAPADQDSWVSVGMIYSWLSSFANRSDSAETTDMTDFDDNPLRQLLSDSISSEEVLEIAEDIEKEDPPWDRDGSYYQTAYNYEFVSSTQQQGNSKIIQVPCGLLNVTLENAHSETDAVALNIEVLDIQDM